MTPRLIIGKCKPDVETGKCVRASKDSGCCGANGGGTLGVNPASTQAGRRHSNNVTNLTTLMFLFRVLTCVLQKPRTNRVPTHVVTLTRKKNPSSIAKILAVATRTTIGRLFAPINAIISKLRTNRVLVHVVMGPLMKTKSPQLTIAKIPAVEASTRTTSQALINAAMSKNPRTNRVLVHVATRPLMREKNPLSIAKIPAAAKLTTTRRFFTPVNVIIPKLKTNHVPVRVVAQSLGEKNPLAIAKILAVAT